MLQLTLEWTNDVLKKLDDGVVAAVRERGLPPQVLLACALLQVVKEIEGKQLTSHPLFSHLTGTYLDEYTLLATEIQHEIDGMLWQITAEFHFSFAQDVLLRKHFDVLVIQRTS